MSLLTEHTIDRIETHVLKRSYPRPITRNSTGRLHGQHGKVHVRVIHTDQGASGWGMSGGPDDEVERFVGRRVSDLFDAGTGTAIDARVLDLPLHDLAGQILGQPVWKMLGGADGPGVTVYTGAIYFDDLEPVDDQPGPDAVLQACAQDAAAGHAHFKLKIGRGNKVVDREFGDSRDVAVTRLVREHYPDAKILVDANDGCTPEGMCGFLQQVADCSLYWIEEPFIEEISGLRKLRDAITEHSPDTIVADGEARNGRNQEPHGPFGAWTSDHLDELCDMCRQGLLDVLLMDVGGMGFTAWRAVMPKIKAAGGSGSPHAWGEPLKTLYAAQLACGLGSVPIVEGVPGTTQGVDDSGYTLRDGELILPDTPGFGLILDF